MSIGDGRIFITSGYEAGSMMIQVEKGASGFTAKKLYDLTSTQFNSEVHTPILSRTTCSPSAVEDAGPLHVHRPRRQGRLAEPGRVRAIPAATRTFDLGGFLLADGMFFVVDGKSGMLRLIEANTTGYKELASAQVLSGEDVWGPLALSDRKLVLRDMNQLVCVQVGPPVDRPLTTRSRHPWERSWTRTTPTVARSPTTTESGASGSRSDGCRSQAWSARSASWRRRCFGPVPRRRRPSSRPGHQHQACRRPNRLAPLPHTYARAGLVVGRACLASSGVPSRASRWDRATQVYALGDDEVRVFERGGRLARAWKAPQKASCLGVAADGRVVVGSPGRVDLFSATGGHIGGFAAGPTDKPADVTAVRLVGDAVLVADAAARVIRRFDLRGAEQGVIGAQNKTGGFMLPNRNLDFDVDAAGVIHATDTGRHQVTSWTLDGTKVAAFGKFGMARLEDFVGCCNPVNVAVAPDGSIVTGEKMVARVKVFNKDRVLQAVIGPEHFDPMCRQIHVAVDSSGRIIAADPERRTIAIYTRS